MKNILMTTFLVLVMALAMGAGQAPGIGTVAYADDITTYDLWVGGVQVTSENMDNILAGDPVNDGKASFTPAEGGRPATLTLNGVDLDDSDWSNGYPPIYYNEPDALDIVLLCISDNIVKSNNSALNAVHSAYGDLTISGTGKLTAIGGISSTESLTIESGTITAIITYDYMNAIATNGGCDLTINGGTVTASSSGKWSRGAYTGGYLVINGGMFTASGTEFAVTQVGGPGFVKNSIPGICWTNVEGSAGEAVIPINPAGQPLSDSIKKVQFGEEQEPVKDHIWDEGTVIDEATCTENGSKKYTCTVCEATRTEEIDVLGHDWDEPTYEWSDDNSKVTATRICKRDSSHIETETVDTTSEVTKEATETEKGEMTYTAVFDNPAFAEQTRKVETPKLEPEEYTITYDLNGGEYNGSTENITEGYEAGTIIKIHAKPTRDGYTFLYWKGSEYQPGDEYTVTEDHVFTAQWEKTVTPSDDDSTTSKKDSSTSAKTGDENDITSLLMLMITSIALIAAMGYRRRNN